MLITFKIFPSCSMSRYRPLEKSTTDIMRTNAELKFALSLIPKGGKIAPFDYIALEVSILIRNNSLKSEEYKAKNCL